MKNPYCVICGEILSNDAKKLSKLKRHQHAKHSNFISQPQEFIGRMYDNLRSSLNQLLISSRDTSCALRASYKVALRIAKTKKMYTVGEILVIGCIKDEMLGEIAAQKVSQVPMSNDTITRRIHNLAEHMDGQLIAQVKSSKYYSLQLDESTDIENKAMLAVLVRYECKGDLE